MTFGEESKARKVIIVKNISELMATEKAVKAGNVTVQIEDGTYILTKGIWIAGENVTFESKSGNRDKVILTGKFKASHIFWITTDHVTIQNISIGEVNNHAIQVHSELDADHAVIRNVRFFDTKEQMLKGSGSSSDKYSDDCLVENCLFEFTKGTAYQYYTGGIDVHKGKNWIVKNNTFKNINFPKGNLTEGAIHFWSNSQGTQILKNTILNCDRGIMLGMDSSSHDKGLIQDNQIEVTRDVGIYLCNANHSSVIGNTVVNRSNYNNSIEYRFKTTGTMIKDNITNKKITSRNGGTAELSNNVIKSDLSLKESTTGSDATVPSENQIWGKRKYPESTSKIVYFSDQVTVNKSPSSFTKEQLAFIAKKFAGTQKISKSFSDQIREYNPNFLVLHYRLGTWQSAVPYITDGEHWSNDYDFTDSYEDWFMHSAGNPKLRVVSKDDGKVLLNIANSQLRAYYIQSLLTQVQSGDYDGSFLDSSAPASLQCFLGKSYEEYSGTKAKDSYVGIYETYMQALSDALKTHKYVTFPNVGAQITGWDPTDYSKATGAFSEGSLDWQRNYGLSDYKLGMNNLLKLVHQDKYLICQTYLKNQEEYNWRMNIISNYLLIKGKYTYISYFADQPFEYYPEFDLDLGVAKKSAQKSIEELKVGQLYGREFAKGIVLVNPEEIKSNTYKIPSTKNAYLVLLKGGGDISAKGVMEGKVELKKVTGTLTLKPKSSAILIWK